MTVEAQGELVKETISLDQVKIKKKPEQPPPGQTPDGQPPTAQPPLGSPSAVP